MEKRTIFAVILIIAVFWISNEFLWKPNVPAQTSVNQPTEETTQTPPPVEVPTADFVQPPAEAVPSDIEINDAIVLENDLLRIELSNRGATVNSIQLKDYTMADKETMVNLIPQGKSLYGLSLTNTNGAVKNLGNEAFTYTIDEVENRVHFTYNTPQGSVEKTFTLVGGYEIGFTVQKQGFQDFDSYTIALDSGIADTETYLKMKNRVYKVVAQVENSITKLSLAKLKTRQDIGGSIDWVSVSSKYFTMGIIPAPQINMNRLIAFKQEESPAAQVSVALSRATVTDEYQLYCGPLIYDNLKQFGHGYENAVELGPKYLLWISRTFLWVLTELHKIIPTWGWTLILFSLFIKALLFPVTHKSFESTSKMQKIQPYVREIQAKYKNDPQTMNVEMQKVYKEHGVSPFGGCLWMFIQMPILFALYPLLRYNIHLRQSEFMWLPDLSEPDPYLILPILMAIFMFVQQKLAAPSNEKLEEMDEKQKAAMQSQKMMMYFMPVMMFFIFRSLSSGLVLYWTVFNIFSIAQQQIINKKLK